MAASNKAEYLDVDESDAGDLEELVDTMMNANNAFDVDSGEEFDEDQAEEEPHQEKDSTELENEKQQAEGASHKLDHMRLSKFPGQAWRKMKHQGHTVKQVEVRKTQKAWYVGDAPDTKLDDMIRIVCLSDTHGLHRQANVPDGDVLVHCGDVTMRGELKTLHSFDSWIRKQSSFTFKLVVPGNHDLSLDPKKARQGYLTMVRYLQVHTNSKQHVTRSLAKH